MDSPAKPENDAEPLTSGV